MGENHVRNAATYESQQIKSSIQDQAFTSDVIKMRILQGKVKIFNLWLKWKYVANVSTIVSVTYVVPMDRPRLYKRHFERGL